MRKRSDQLQSLAYVYGCLGIFCLCADLARDVYIAAIAVIAAIFAVGSAILKELGR